MRNAAEGTKTERRKKVRARSRGVSIRRELYRKKVRERRKRAERDETDINTSIQTKKRCFKRQAGSVKNGDGDLSVISTPSHVR